jgi:hypothetical protein
MTSPWWFFETAASGDLGRRLQYIAMILVAIVVMTGLIWHRPELWLFHQFVSWKTHEVQSQLRHILRTLPRPQASVAGTR